MVGDFCMEGFQVTPEENQRQCLMGSFQINDAFAQFSMLVHVQIDYFKRHRWRIVSTQNLSVFNLMKATM